MLPMQCDCASYAPLCARNLHNRCDLTTPTSAAAVADWCRALWQHKDQSLTSHAETGHFFPVDSSLATDVDDSVVDFDDAFGAITPRPASWVDVPLRQSRFVRYCYPIWFALTAAAFGTYAQYCLRTGYHLPLYVAGGFLAILVPLLAGALWAATPKDKKTRAERGATGAKAPAPSLPAKKTK